MAKPSLAPSDRASDPASSTRAAAVQSLVSQQEATLNHVVGRVEQFRRAEQELLKEKTALVEQVETLSHQVGVNEARIAESIQQATTAQAELATKSAEMRGMQEQWDETQKALTEKHGLVLQKYAQKKQAVHAANDETAKQASRADGIAAKMAGFEKTVKVLTGQKEEDEAKHTQLVRELEQVQRTLDAHAEQGLSKDKEWQTRHEDHRKQAGEKEVALMRKQAEMEKALAAHAEEKKNLQTALSRAETELGRLRDAKPSAGAESGASEEVHLRMMRRLDRENKKYNAAVVEKTMQVRFPLCFTVFHCVLLYFSLIFTVFH